MKTRLLLLPALLAGIMLQSCAYYNTFYNTKKNFREGLAENKKRVGDKPTAQEVQKFDLAIEKASKVLQLYPKSKFADDAVMILGQSFFYKQEFLKAQRKFDELVANFPKSNLVPACRLWLAKTNIELRDYAGAERVLRELQKQPRRGGLNEEAQSLLGEIYFRQGMFSLAAQEFEAASKELDDKTLRGRSLMRLGECYQKTGNFSGAVESFRLATSIGGDQDFKFQSSFQFAIALKSEGRYEEALNIYRSLLAEFPTYKDVSLVKVQIADATNGMGNAEDAKRLFEDILDSHPRTEAAAAAYFYLGEIYERKEGDFPKAQDHYDKVRKESVRSDKITEATRRSKNIAEFLKLKQNITDLEKQLQQVQSGEKPETVASADTASTGSATSASSSTRSRKRGQNKTTAANSPQHTAENVAVDLAKNKIQTAQLYYFQFDQVDAAIPLYFDVARNFPTTSYAPQALYTLAYIFEGNNNNKPEVRDSIFAVLMEKYPDSPQGRAAKKRLGETSETQAANGDQPSSERADFLKAEKILFEEKESSRAIEAYQEFITKYPLSPNVPKSMYAIGWIQENRLGDNRQAFETYRQLIEKFPDSDYSKDLRTKIAAAEKEFKIADSDKSVLANVPIADTTAADSLGGAKQTESVDEDEARRKLIEKDDLPIRRPPKSEDQPYEQREQ